MQFDYTDGSLNIKNITISATGQIDLNNRRIVNVPNIPVAGTDVVNKTYVDSMALGLGPKVAVYVKTTAADLASLSGTYTAAGAGLGKTLTRNTNGAFPNIDSTPVTVGRRILFAHSTPADANYGIYDLTDAGSAGTPWILTRSTDCDNSPGSEVTTGIYTLVETGTLHGTTGWCLTTTGTITIDVTAQTWAQITAAGAASSLDGLSDAATNATCIVLGTTTAVPAGTNCIIISKTWANPGMSGNDNFIIGNSTAPSLSSGTGNCLIGNNVATSLTSGSANIIIGSFSAINLNTIAYNNVVIGYGSGGNMTNCNTNVIVGTNSGLALTTGSGNVLLGVSLNVSTGAASNQIVIGYNITSAGNNTVTFPTGIATNTLAAGANQRIAAFNTSNGRLFPITDGTAGQVLQTNGSGTLSWANPGGATSLDGLSDAYVDSVYNVLNFGNTMVMSSNPTGSVIISRQWTNSTMTGGGNMIIGNSGNQITGGAGNILIGNSGASITSGSGNVIIGNQNVGITLTTGSFNIIFGFQANVSSTTASNRIVFGQNVSGTIDDAIFFRTATATNTTAADTTNNYSVVFVGNTGRLASCAKDADVGVMLDTTTGTASGTNTLVPTGTSATNDNFATLVVELNAIRAALRNHGIMA